jgi:argininosuccinate lyase
MLAKQKIILQEEAETIKNGLLEILSEIKEGRFSYKIEDEDIHMAIEKRLTEKVGSVAGKLHTARSRNDQVALDFRLFLRSEIENIRDYIKSLMTVLLNRAKAEIDAIMPGYTHLQTAQPILFSHYLMAYFQMFKRDHQRFFDLLKRLNFSPLGAGALAGTTFDIDREFVANKLNFTAPTENSLDSVSDRDFALEFLSAASICQPATRLIFGLWFRSIFVNFV